jgi:formylglycine-generating enzyme required for sulfatase activity
MGAKQTRSFGNLCSALYFALLLELFCPAAASGQAGASGGGRVALVIGNASYLDATSPLPTAVKDARLLADELRHNHFEVEEKESANRETMRRAIDMFVAKIQPGSTALIYFSGFGIQSARQSYLIPVDAQIWSEPDVKRDGFGVDDILSQMRERGALTKIAIIDASRPNPYERRFRAAPAGLATIDAPDGTLVIFAAAPGKLSSNDGTGEISLFMQELLNEIRAPDTTAEDAFNHARVGVSRASNREQIPWVVSSLSEDFFFSKTALPASPSRVASAPAISGSPNPVAPRGAPLISAAPPAKPIAPPLEPKPNITQPTPPLNKASAAPGDEVRDCPDCPEMLVIPAGSFEMGAAATPFDRPLHRVTIAQPFRLSRNEITFEEWDKCVAAQGCRFKPDDRGWGRGDHPVINVSWSDAKEYISWLSRTTEKAYRLPSEAEWEFAARGGKRTPYYWGSQVGSRMANCRDCKTGEPVQPLPVGTFPPNPFGLNDMAGNVAEWLEDCWNESYRGAPTDGSAWTTGDCSLRVLRGGSFDTSSAYLRSAARFRYDADVRYFANGFRVAREMP